MAEEEAEGRRQSRLESTSIEGILLDFVIRDFVIKFVAQEIRERLDKSEALQQKLLTELQSLRGDVAALRTQGDNVMATVAELEQKLDAVQQSVGTLQTNVNDANNRIAADVENFKSEIKKLQDIVAAGGTVTEAQLEPLAAKATAISDAVTAVATAVAAIDPDPSNPVVSPESRRRSHS